MSQWFKKKKPAAQAQYLREHPRSKMRKSSKSTGGTVVSLRVKKKRKSILADYEETPKGSRSL